MSGQASHSVREPMNSPTCPPGTSVLTISRASDGEPGLNDLCPAFKRFFAHAAPQAEKMAIEQREAPFCPGDACAIAQMGLNPRQ